MIHQGSFRLKFETGAATHVGRVRDNNEDSYVVKPEYGVWAVADGVGGYDGGEIASAAVTSAIASIGPSSSPNEQLTRFESRIDAAHFHIRAMAQERGGKAMGTTVAALLINGKTAWFSWAGDSRIYRIRGPLVDRATRDHSEVQELLDSGAIGPAEARTWPRRNVITRAIGIFDAPDLEARSAEVAFGDVFVLCSDGLTNHISEEEIAVTVAGQRAQRACDALVEATLARGATDNVTVVVVRCHRAETTSHLTRR